jgi:tRNA(Ile)-lysidine synthetase-like protein
LSDYSKNNCREIKRVCLPDKITLVITPERAYFERQSDNTRHLEETKITLGITKLEKNCGTVAVFRNETEIEKHFPKNIYKKAIHTEVNEKLFDGTITVRSRQDGDTFSFSNMTKKIKKMFNEAKIPIEIRDILPIFCDEKGIFWIPGFPLRDDAKAQEHASTLHIYYFSEEITL